MKQVCIWAFAAAMLLSGLAPTAAFAAAAPPADYDLPSGHFYTQTNGAASDPSAGYSVTDEGGIQMWSEFQRLGGVAALGYPVSRRFQANGFIEQTFQKNILQWQPDQQKALPVNVMDLLHDAGADGVLQADSQIPPPSGAPADAGKSWQQVQQAHLKLLDFPNAGFKTAYNSVPDPLATFGLPTSAITDEGASYTIRLQRTAMQLWKSDQPWAKANTVTLVNAGDLAKQHGLVPAGAMQPESGRITTGAAARTPWSGWWWPSLDGGNGPHLFDAGGPLAKYDAYVRALGQPDPHTRQWELDHFQFNDAKLDWAGKCNGWAVSALAEPEPTKPQTVNGITFSVADQKALLADYYFADPAAFLVGRKETGGVKAADFQRTILDYVGNQHQGLVINAFTGADQVASFAVYRFQATYLPDPADANKTHVRMTIWAADYHVDPNFVGLKNWPDNHLKTYTYFIFGDRANPSGGEWEGDSVAGTFAHPENLWSPDLAPADRNKFGALTSPNLDYSVIQKILKGA
ncbi:MAG TPA: hypothetical protein VMW62_03610 [Chloroflexota bacterium]|nr:hypothetical protein [Chloroflexota bacterium]